MTIELPIAEDELRYLNVHAKGELGTSVCKYARQVLAEAGRLEAAVRTAQDDPQITSSHIRDADLIVSRGYRRPPKQWFQYGFQIVSSVSSMILGLIYDPSKMGDPSYQTTFIAVMVVALGTGIYLTFKD